jgi:hypothetical protein
MVSGTSRSFGSQALEPTLVEQAHEDVPHQGRGLIGRILDKNVILLKPSDTVIIHRPPGP